MKRILIVDDEDHIRVVLEARLSSAGFEVHQAVDGEEAIKKVNEIKPNLIVLDIKMPIMDGWEVLEKIKSNPETKSIPVIMLTVLSKIEEKMRAFAIGAEDYLTKPFSDSELMEKIFRHLSTENLNFT